MQRPALGWVVLVLEQTARADGRFGVWRWTGCQVPESPGDEDRTGRMVDGCANSALGWIVSPKFMCFWNLRIQPYVEIGWLEM